MPLISTKVIYTTHYAEVKVFSNSELGRRLGGMDLITVLNVALENGNVLIVPAWDDQHLLTVMEWPDKECPLLSSSVESCFP